ncbi:MAG: hypothetical protein JJV97_03635 [SAR324 cluster bacterium]|nr:hypothetical protein [SAR324 cluster bacterium]
MFPQRKFNHFPIIINKKDLLVPDIFSIIGDAMEPDIKGEEKIPHLIIQLKRVLYT